MSNADSSNTSSSSSPSTKIKNTAPSSSSSSSSSSGTLLLSTIHKLKQKNIQIILASQSPRRAEILEMMGLESFHQIPSPLNESDLQLELKSRSKPPSPMEYVQILAERKAGAFADALLSTFTTSMTTESTTTTTTTTTDDVIDSIFLWNNGPDPIVIIIGSDTIVDYNGSILEKPKNKQNANEMLQTLSGNWHAVHTGVAIYSIRFNLDTSISTTSTTTSATTANHNHPKKNLHTSIVESTKVKFVPLSDSDIQSYIDTGEPMDKAGSYGIQGIGGQMVQEIQGDYFTVMGLPMNKVSMELATILNELI